MEWATWTENPTVTAEHIPQNSHRDVETRPTAAESSAPRRPTIAASMYCIRMLESWASIAGQDSEAVRRRSCVVVSGRPERIIEMSAIIACFLCGDVVILWGEERHGRARAALKLAPPPKRLTRRGVLTRVGLLVSG